MQLEDVNLTAQEIMELTKKYLIETYPRFPFVAVKAKGQYIYDSEGQAWLDFYGGIAVNNCGNVNDRVTAALQNQAAELVHTFNYPYTIPQALLAQRICESIGMDKIFFQSSGTDANEGMIKLARKYGHDTYGPGKYHIVTAKKGFHGRTYGALSATGQPGSVLHQGFGPLLPGFTYADFNDLDSFKAACGEETVAIMIEPVQGKAASSPLRRNLSAACGNFATGRAFCSYWTRYRPAGAEPAP